MKAQIIKNGVKRKISDSYEVTNLVTKDVCENISVAISEAKNHSETTKNIRSDRAYYVLEGKIMVKQGKEEFIAEKGDIVLIPKNTEYHFEGSFKAVLINSPAFDPKDEKITEM